MGGNVSLVAKDNSYGIAFYESYRNRNPYDRDGDGFSELGKLNMNTFGFRAYYRPTHFSRINLEYQDVYKRQELLFLLIYNFALAFAEKVVA